MRILLLADGLEASWLGEPALWLHGERDAVIPADSARHAASRAPAIDLELSLSIPFSEVKAGDGDVEVRFCEADFDGARSWFFRCRRSSSRPGTTCRSGAP